MQFVHILIIISLYTYYLYYSGRATVSATPPDSVGILAQGMLGVNTKTRVHNNRVGRRVSNFSGFTKLTVLRPCAINYSHQR